MFFYNSETRAAASGEINAAGDYVNLKDFPTGQFGEWSAIVSVTGGRLFFYKPSGAAASGELNAAGDYVNLVDFPAGQFGDWSHIASADGRLFFYNSETRAAASGELDAGGGYVNLMDFPAGQLGDWSHIASADGRLFFYNSETRAAASGELDAAGDYVNLVDFPAGQFGDWSHIASTGGRLFFYNWDTRAAASGELSAGGDYVNLVDFPTGQFGEWSHIVSVTGGRLFFYKPSGAAASGELNAGGDYVNLKDFPTGQFGRWHLIAGTPAVQVVTPAVQVVFDLEVRDKTSGPFPSNIFTVHDAGQNTGLRVNLPLPDPAVRPSDHADISVIDTLDGFNITPRISIPFNGEIDLSTVNDKTVFLQRLGSSLPSEAPEAKRVGINQIVWDAATTTLHVTANDVLDQHARYVLVVTTGVRDKKGNPIGCEAFELFRRDLSFGQTGDQRLKDYRKELLDALQDLKKAGSKAKEVVVASVFTTRSVTTELEKIREQVNAAPVPAAADVTTFPLDSVTNVTFKLQTGTAPNFAQPVSLMNLLTSTPGAIGTIAFGKYVSPDYRDSVNVIPATKTKSGAPKALGQNEITFDLYLPSGTKPPSGWPVAIAAHGAGTHKQNGTPITIAATLASKGLATIAINGPGNGGGPLGELTVTRNDGSTATIPSGGRGKDTNGDGTYTPGEGASAAFFPIRDRDRVRQTAVDLLQLVRVIDSLDDVDPSRIYYAGQSLGGLCGTLFAAVEPKVRAAVLNVTFPFLGTLLSPVRGRPAAGAALAARKPSLINSPGIASIDGVAVTGSAANYFNENLPLRDKPPVINTIAGAMAIQEVFDNTEWVQQSGGALAYCSLLRSSGKPILIQFAKGDQQAPNPLSTAVVRAGNFAYTTTFYRNDLAVARNPASNPPLPKDAHDFLNQTLGSTTGGLPGGAQGSIARAAQQQIADFLASDGQTINDPDGPDTLFEVPIPLPLPETTDFIL